MQLPCGRNKRMNKNRFVFAWENYKIKNIKQAIEWNFDYQKRKIDCFFNKPNLFSLINYFYYMFV